MFRPQSLFKNVILGVINKSIIIPGRNVSNSIKTEKILLVSKMTRYEYEKLKHKHLNDKEFENELKSRGTNFENLIYHYDLHKTFENKVTETLLNMGIDVEVVNRFTWTEEKLNWADIIVPIGGDGTFLLAASRVLNNRQPVIGFNSDPTRSEGHLCLPKKYCAHVAEAIKNLNNGNFKWLLRSRIRTTLSGKKIDINPSFLYEIDIKVCTPTPCNSFVINPDADELTLPVLALNEVFVGEAFSARVSHLQMMLNGEADETRIKCSGVCVSTGTGSTSWHLSINRLPEQSVAELLRLVNINPDNEALAKKVADMYNKNLIFDSASSEMGYTIRDLISAAVWPQPKGIQPRGFAKSIIVKSCCFDANLVIDGGVSFPFNDGAIARMEIRPEDALRTVIMSD